MSYACTFRFDTASAGVEALRLQRRLAPANLVEGAHANRIGVLIVPHSPDRHQTRGPSPISAIGHQSVARLKFVRPLRGTKSIFSAHGQAMAELPINQGATESEEDPNTRGKRGALMLWLSRSKVISEIEFVVDLPIASIGPLR